MTLEDINQFKLKIQSENIALSIKYEYLKGLSELLEIYEYSFFACENKFNILKNNFQNEVVLFNQNLNVVWCYLKENKNFLNINDNDFIYKWLINNLGVLLVIKQNNLRAYDIVMELKLEKQKEFPIFEIDDKYIFRLKQLIDHLRSYGDLPVQTDNIFKFDDGVCMGRFIAHNKRKIMMLKEGNEFAFELASYFERKNLSFDDRLKEVYDYLMKYNNLPFIGDNKVTFSNGEVMSTWFSHNRKKLSLMNNYMAQKIIKYLNGRKLNFEDKLNELYNYYALNGFIPTALSREVFSDDSLMGGFVRDNKAKLMQISLVDNRAQEILDFLNSKNLSEIEKMKEACLYLKQCGELPFKSDKKVCFSDGSYMGYWIYSHYKDIENSHNRYSKEILNYLKEKQVNLLTFDDKLNEAYNYWLEVHDLPYTSDKSVKFSNGQIMGLWLSHNRKKLMNIDDERAKAVINCLDERRGLSFEEKIAELYFNLLDEDFLITSDSTFSDGVNIKKWLRDNKKQFELLKDKNNAVSLIWKKCFKLSFAEKINEAYEYLSLYHKIPFQSDKEVLFSDGSYIGMWISNNKRKIYFGDNDVVLLKEKMVEVNPHCFEKIRMAVKKHG